MVRRYTVPLPPGRVSPVLIVAHHIDTFFSLPVPAPAVVPEGPHLTSSSATSHVLETIEDLVGHHFPCPCLCRQADEDRKGPGPNPFPSLLLPAPRHVCMCESHPQRSVQSVRRTSRFSSSVWMTLDLWRMLHIWHWRLSCLPIPSISTALGSHCTK